MLEYLDKQTKLTVNQYKIVAAAIIGDMLEFFDFFLIGFVLAIIIKPWHLTFGISAFILLSSGIGAILGSFFWGYIADRVGRRKVFIATVLNFSIATGILALTPQDGWIFLSVFRFLTGFGVGGLYSVDMPLVQEFVPTSKRGFIGGMITCAVPIGIMLGSFLGAFLSPLIGWRGMFAAGLLPALVTLLIRVWVPESPRWLAGQGRAQEARISLAWALQVDPESIPLSALNYPVQKKARFRQLLQYPRSLIVSFLGSLGAQTGVYGVNLWAPTLLLLVLHTTAQQASFYMIFIASGGFAGRIAFSILSDAIGRRKSGALVGFGAGIFLSLAGIFYNDSLGGISLFWLLLIVTHFFGDGGFSIVGPYSAEVWPSNIRATGMGAAYGFGGIGKIIGPLGLAVIVGSSNVLKPAVSIHHLTPAFIYLGAWFALTGVVYGIFGMETGGRSFEQIEDELAGRTPAAKVAAMPKR